MVLANKPRCTVIIDREEQKTKEQEPVSTDQQKLLTAVTRNRTVMITVRRMKCSVTLKCDKVAKKDDLVNTSFVVENNTFYVKVRGNGYEFVVKACVAHSMLVGFIDPPAREILIHWAKTGKALSVLGNLVLADGFDYLGAPSWLVVAEPRHYKNTKQDGK